MVIKSLAFSVLTSLVLTSCGSNSGGTGSDGNDSGGSLNLTDELNPPADLKKFEAKDLPSELNSKNIFWQHKEKKTTNTTPSSSETDTLSCPMFNNAPVRAGMGFVEIYIRGDVKAEGCLKGEGEALVEYLNLEAYFRVECPNQDMSRYNGKTISELGNVASPDATCANLPTIRTATWSKTEGVFYIFGKIKTTSSSGQVTSKGEPCEVNTKDGISTFGDCLHYDRSSQEVLSTSTKPNGPQTNLPGSIADSGFKVTPSGRLFVADLTGLTGDGMSSYYSTGEIKFTLNQWKGKMSYTAPKTAPKWDAKNESAGTTANGVLGQSYLTPVATPTPVSPKPPTTEPGPVPQTQQPALFLREIPAFDALSALGISAQQLHL